MLRERDSDLGPLIDGLVKRINDQSERVKEPGFERKHISEDARKLLMQQTWPGNIREMENTLRRAMVWSDGTVVSTDDISDAMLPALPIAVAAETILNRPLEQGIDLKSLIDLSRSTIFVGLLTGLTETNQELPNSWGCRVIKL